MDKCRICGKELFIDTQGEHVPVMGNLLNHQMKAVCWNCYHDAEEEWERNIARGAHSRNLVAKLFRERADVIKVLRADSKKRGGADVLDDDGGKRGEAGDNQGSEHGTHEGKKR